ncbi:MAG TPA: cytochrome c oxidase assembly protein [Acidimicrobiales bacterium]|nr:cytochrome c oxidase assembly protein [Acidimicrobiales bacterium]
MRLHVLLTGIQTGPLDLVADALELLLLALYALGRHRLVRRGRTWPAWNTAAFAAGVALLWIAVGSGLAAYDESSATLHVVQHVLLMMVVPPLLALGKPVTLATQAASRRNQLRILQVVHSRAAATLTFPVVVWFLYYGTMYVYFMTGAYPYSIAHPLFHDATHLWCLLVGYLFWHPLVGLDPARWRWSYPVRIGSLFLGMPFEAFLGIGISEMPHPIAPVNSLADTHSAGDTFWILSMTATGLCLGVVVLQWFGQLARETAREDRRAEIAAERNRARAEELGVHLPPGMTLPWWRLDELEARQARRAGSDVPGASTRAGRGEPADPGGARSAER